MIPYLWMKAAHVASVLLFIGGLFAQSFAVAAGRRGDADALLLIGHWDRRVTVPAMIVVWLTGAAIAVDGGWFGNSWLWAKLVFVLALTGLHGVQSGRLRRMRRGEQPRTRMQAERVATCIAVSAAIIALLVVAKPF